MKKRQLIAAGMAGVMVMMPQAALAQTVHVDDGAELTFSASVGGEQAEDINQVLETAKITLAMGKVDEQRILNLSLDALDKNWVKVVLGVDPDKQELKMSLPEIDDHVYTVNLGDLQNMAQEMQGKAALPEEIDPQKQMETYTQVLVPYMETIAQYVGEWGESSEGEIALPLLETNVDGEMLSLAPTGKQCAELAEALADQVEADEALAQLTGDWAKYLKDVKEVHAEDEEAQSEETSEELAYAAAEELGVDTENISDEDIALLENFATEVPKAIRETAQEMAEVEDPGIRVTVGTEEDHLVLVDLHLEEDGEGTTGLHLENYDGAYVATMSEYEEVLRLAGTYAVDGDLYSGEFALNIEDTEVLSGRYAFDAAVKSLLGIPYGEASLDAMGITSMLKVEAGKDGGDVHSFSISGLEQAFGEEYPIQQVTFAMASKEGADLELPEGAEENLISYSRDQISTLVGQISEKYLNKWAGNLL